jgi:all-trans-nonaprenyl-diphosphate synthase
LGFFIVLGLGFAFLQQILAPIPKFLKISLSANLIMRKFQCVRLRRGFGVFCGSGVKKNFGYLAKTLTESQEKLCYKGLTEIMQQKPWMDTEILSARQTRLGNINYWNGDRYTGADKTVLEHSIFKQPLDDCYKFLKESVLDTKVERLQGISQYLFDVQGKLIRPKIGLLIWAL